jgi:phosphotriesterase-related protein
MSVVTTVLGDIDAAGLGVTLPHEHLIASAVAQWVPPEDPALLMEYVKPYDMRARGDVQLAPFSYREAMHQTDVHVALEELRGLAEAGDRTVVELSIPGIGRDPVALKVLSQLTGVNIVMGCGEYVEFAHSPYIRHASAEMIRDVLVEEITKGVGGTGVRAGIIGEIGTSNTPTPAELKVLHGAALAQLETGVALNIHRSIFPDPLGTLPAVDHVLALGVDPGKVVVSHVDERPEPEFALLAAERGVFVELDTFGMEQWAVSARRGEEFPRRSFDQDRYDMVRILLDRGYLDQILLSHDICMKPQFVAHGGWGLRHLTRNVVPRLAALGVSGDEIATMRVDNPRRALERPR